MSRISLKDKNLNEDLFFSVLMQNEMVERLKADEEMEGNYMNLLWAREGGREEGIRLVAVNLLDTLGDQEISEKTGLSIEKVKELRRGNGGIHEEY